jgi:starvation-inducible DNA-binding protein
MAAPSAPSQFQSRPAQKPLATMTDLTQQQVMQITEALNPLVANAFALYVKTKNFHWHMSGSHFREYHHMLDKQGEQIFASIDPMAERVRKVGGTTIHSISQINALQTIRDDNDEFVSPGEMMRRLMEDHAQYAKMIRSAHEVCERCNDVATASLLETVLDETERRKWFLFETAQGMNNAD